MRNSTYNSAIRRHERLCWTITLCAVAVAALVAPVLPAGAQQ